jgi:hypothetical protein
MERDVSASNYQQQALQMEPPGKHPIERMKATFKCAILDLYSRGRAGGGDGGF